MAVKGETSSKYRICGSNFQLDIQHESSCLLHGKRQEILHQCEFCTKKYPTLKLENRQNDRTGHSSVNCPVSECGPIGQFLLK